MDLSSWISKVKIITERNACIRNLYDIFNASNTFHCFSANSKFAKVKNICYTIMFFPVLLHALTQLGMKKIFGERVHERKRTKRKRIVFNLSPECGTDKTNSKDHFNKFETMEFGACKYTHVKTSF